MKLIEFIYMCVLMCRKQQPQVQGTDATKKRPTLSAKLVLKYLLLFLPNNLISNFNFHYLD